MKLYRFGTFELNTSGRELLKQGRRLRLQEQPLRVLELLLEAPGRVVTRQELRQRLWPGGVHVDFELGLTGAIKRLRQALGDAADNPRFVETIPRAGYRFIAPVEVVTETAPPPEVEPPPAGSRATAAADHASRRGVRLAAVAVLAVVTGLALLVRPVLPPPRVTRVARLTSSGRAWPQESLLTDGARLYYTEFAVGIGFRLRQVLANGSEDTVAPGLPGHTLFRALSPDRTTFLAIAQDDAERGSPSPLWSVPVVGGAPRRLGQLRTNDFAWSPDGATLAFAREERLLVCRADGSAERPLASAPGHVIAPRWSPDGRRLRFTVLGERGDLALWEVGATGEGLGPLRLGWPGTPMEGFGEWTGDGRHFVFVSRREGTSSLWMLEETIDRWHRRREEPVQLTTGPVSYARPLPSRDGRQIFALGTEPGAELVRYDRARAEWETYLGGRAAEHLDWSRDGRWIAWVAYPEGTLWRARADGSEELRLTVPPLRASLPRWSPDGSRILFTGALAGSPPRVFTVSPEGGELQPLLDAAVPQTDPSWSADGATVAIGGDRDGATVALFRFDVARRVRGTIPGTGGLHAPVWSPDGRQLVARSAASGQLLLVDPAGGRTRVLSRRRADYAAWSADSRFVYFNSAVDEHLAVFRVRAADGVEEEVAELPFKAAGSYGAWTGVAPDGPRWRCVTVVAPTSTP